MNIQGSAAKYVELSNQVYGVIVDTFASAMRSGLDFWKSVWHRLPAVRLDGDRVDRGRELRFALVSSGTSRNQGTRSHPQLAAGLGQLQRFLGQNGENSTT
jgi:hypothetical protein